MGIRSVVIFMWQLGIIKSSWMMRPNFECKKYAHIFKNKLLSTITLMFNALRFLFQCNEWIVYFEQHNNAFSIALKTQLLNFLFSTQIMMQIMWGLGKVNFVYFSLCHMLERFLNLWSRNFVDRNHFIILYDIPRCLKQSYPFWYFKNHSILVILCKGYFLRIFGKTSITI